MVGVKNRMKFEKDTPLIEREIHRKERDLRNHKIKYWRKIYPFDLKFEDYDEFNAISKKVNKIKNCIDDFINFDSTNRDDLIFYGQNKFAFDLCLPHYDYICNLPKIETCN